MTNEEARRLATGIYRLYWESGGSSIASVGMLHNGDRWFAATNWVAPDTTGIASMSWASVARVKLVIAGVIDRSGDADERRRNQRGVRERVRRLAGEVE